MSTMTLPTMADVKTFVLQEATRSELDDLLLAIAQRKTTLGMQIEQKDRVRVSNIRPKYLQGITGMVTRTYRSGNKLLAEVKTDSIMYNQRYWGTDELAGIPVECLVKIDA